MKLNIAQSSAQSLLSILNDILDFSKVEAGKLYQVEEAVALLTELSGVKFKESVDVAVNLGVDPRKSDQNVRGASVLPHGTGKTARVIVSKDVSFGTMIVST